MVVRKPRTKKTTKKKTIVKKGMKKTVTKRVVGSTKKIVSVATTKPTTVIKKTPVSEATPPEDVKVAGWKKKLRTGKVKARVLRSKEDTWDQARIDNKDRGKRKKGLVILLDGGSKVGKTNFTFTPADFDGFEGKRRIIPAGHPIYVLDTENASEDEADFNFPEHIDGGNIIIHNCFVENPITKEIDPTKSIEELEEWAYALSDDEQGTLVIDNFSDYCDWAYFKLVDKILGIGFDDDGKEKKKPIPIQYKWRTKKVKSFLRRLRNINMNVILVAQTKDEWASSGSGAMDGYKTGNQISEVLKGSDYWVDVIARYEKETIGSGDDKETIRTLRVIDSRFETENMKGRSYELTGNPTFSDLIDLFKDLL